MDQVHVVRHKVLVEGRSQEPSATSCRMERGKAVDYCRAAPHARSSEIEHERHAARRPDISPCASTRPAVVLPAELLSKHKGNVL